MESYGINPNANIWKIFLGKDDPQIKNECFAENNIRIDFAGNDNDSSVKILYEHMKKGDIVVSVKSFYEADGVAIIDDEEAPEDLKDKTSYKRYRKVKWIFKNETVDFKSINNGFGMTRPTITGMPNINRALLMELIKEYLEIDEKRLPCVFIIDEINRGNISKIFGELITLIEKSKRFGSEEAMSCTLPYSGDPFTVPDNVYILGTMNTADRSIALMDTALRRRFDFIEMMPKYDVDFMQGLKVGNIDIVRMLKVMNYRIEVLYDREHTLGHAFFKDLDGLQDDEKMVKLGLIFENKIIPLLQEYFFEDYEKIALVLGDNAKTDDNYKFIITKDIDASKFKNGDIPDSISEMKIFKLNIEEAIKHEESYKEIYE